MRFAKPMEVSGISLDCSGCRGRVIVPYPRRDEVRGPIENCPICGTDRVTRPQDPWKVLSSVFTALSEWEERGISLVFEEEKPDAG